MASINILLEKSSRFRSKNFLAAMGLVGVTQIGLRKFVSIPTLNNSDRIPPSNGRMAEWSNAPDSKSGIRLYRIEGSNPSLSAIIDRYRILHSKILFFVYREIGDLL